MKKTKLTRSLLAACSIVALSAVMYGCTGDGAENDLTATQDDLKQAEMERDAALAAQAAAEAERDAANAAAAAAAQAQATAEAERDAANAAAATAAMAQADAEAAQAAAEMAQADAEAAQATAEAAQAAAEAAQATAEAAQAAAEAAQATAEMAQADAEAAQAAAEAAQGMAEGERDAANAAAAAAAAAQATAEAERDAANTARDAANTARDAANTARDAALAAQSTAEGERDAANTALATANTNLETANTNLAAAITRAETAEADLKTANENLRLARERIAALEAGTAEDVLDPIKEAASTAATAAGNASTAAGDAAGAAETAADNRATLQTGDADSAADAADAKMYAGMAADEAMNAATASQMAQDAANAVDAALQRNAAQAAQTAAEGARDKAVAAQGEAEADAMVELKIDGTMKSVGGTTVDATAGKNTVTTGSGATAQTVTTGLIDEPETAGVTTDGRAAVAGSRTDPTVYKSPRVNAAARDDVKIGKTLDASDDSARLLLITHYAGTKTVRVFASDAATDTLTGTARSGNRIQTAGVDTPDDATDDVFVTVRRVGTYYRAAGGTEGTLEPNGPTDADPPVQQGDTVGATAEGTTVYSHTAGPDGIPGNADDALQYVVLESSTTTGTGTTVIYNNAQIQIAINRDGDTTTGLTADQAATAVASGVTGAAAGDELVEVTARLPGRAAYNHVHFGAWASLGTPMANGDQSPSDLGIGFVQSIGAGMTGSDMPNNGTASYSGNWAAAIQAADFDGDGDITLESGVATVTANFTKASITAMLTDLATLKGDIAGNTFSGDSAIAAAGSGLNVDGTFTGSFSGGFYGAQADEAAGVFDFESAGNQAGAFRGAFGGQRVLDE